ncbi:MAG: hypothetical protein A3F80_08935 [Candidatus Melainabacteria bacterium RIFCSPLOWO2_12_FULL_35_11]|nr:MAG: hypothetical protein A3F80_08935 [Candidatus Melainabacteria bacterium RIFCSPLOWO2_12_FULL_35_11]
MDVAQGKYTAGWGFNEIYSSSKENAARALRIIVEKIGERLEDENEIIKKLLNASSPSIRTQGALAASNSYKHAWRRNIQGIGLITAFKTEEDDDIRQTLSYAIAYASPKSIIESHTIDGSSEKFCPLTRLISDRNYAVRRNLLWGVTEIFAAQYQKGTYYETFKETPELTARNRVDCFDYSLRIVERLCSSSPNNDELSMLHNSCYVIFYSIDDELIRSIKDAGQLDNYEKVEKRLSKIDIIEFIRLTTKPTINNPELNTWSLAYRAADRVLYLKSKDISKPLLYFFELKASVKQLMDSTTESKTGKNLENALERIDNAIEFYLTDTAPKSIKFGTHSEFNLTFAKLLDLLKDAQRDPFKHAILNLFDTLNAQGLKLEDLGNVSLEKALTEQNKLKMKEKLRNVIYSKSVSEDFFLNPPSKAPVGKALQLYRKTSKSFKDYFGMYDLKERALKLAGISIAGESLASKAFSFVKGLIFGKAAESTVKNSGRPIGLLLSGAPGTGKSSFGEVLANELGLPLEILISSKVNEGENGEVFISKNKNQYTLEQYFDEIKKIGRCVILVDEIDEITSPDDPKFVSKISSFFQQLRDADLPVLVIATTNRPILDSVYGITIDKSGSSKELDQSLKEYVYPDLFDLLNPCYLFHKKSVVEDFAKNYLENLLKAGKIKGELDLIKASKLARGLTPLKIMNTLSKSSISSETVIDELRKLRLESGIAKQQESVIRSITEILLSSGTHSIEGQIDYIELALAAEDTPTNLIVETVRKAPSPLSQIVLMESLEKLQ